MEEVDYPIYYIAVAIILASITYGMIWSNKVLTVLSVGIFFYLCLKLTSRKFLLIIIIFYLIQLVICSNYYILKINQNINNQIFTIVENKGYYYLAESKGRLFRLNNLNESMSPKERIKVSGVYRKDKDFEKGILGQINVNSHTKLKEDFIRKLYKLKENLYEKLSKNIGSRKAGLVMSISLGYKEELSDEDDADMSEIGMIHAISVSGLHVGIIFVVIKKLIKKTEYSLIITGLYVILTGAAFSSIRAFIMLSICNLALKFRKNNNSLSSLLISAIIILIIKPYAIFSLGFQLSYMAVLGILLFSKWISRKLFLLPKFIRSNIAVSLSAQIFTLPIIILHFNKVSILSIIANLFLDKIIFLIIIIGNSLLFLVNLEYVFIFLCFVLIKIVKLMDYIIDLTLGLFEGQIYGGYIIATLYIIMLISFFFIYNGNKKFWLFPMISFIVFSIYVYSPILRVEYYEGEGVLISYRGEISFVAENKRMIVSNIKNKYGAENIYFEDDNDILYGRVIIKEGKVFIKGI